MDSPHHPDRPHGEDAAHDDSPGDRHGRAAREAAATPASPGRPTRPRSRHRVSRQEVPAFLAAAASTARGEPSVDVAQPTSTGRSARRQPTDGPIRIVIAEDDPLARETLSALLGTLGHDVVAAVDSGTAAVERLEELHPDVVLLDVHMPGGSGLDAAEEITSRAPDTAVVLISGDPELRLSERQVEATAALAYLSKPATPAALDATIRLADARSRAAHAARSEARMRKRQLEQRKLVERAKGIVMRRMGCSEEQAYRVLRRTSQDRSTPLAEIAAAVIDSETRSGEGGGKGGWSGY